MPQGPEFDTGGPVKVAVVNHATAPLGVDLGALVSALQTQCDRDFEPRWGCSASLYTTATPDPSDWVLGLFDDADQADALGYHELTDAGLPVGKVFVKTTIGDGGLVSVTTSHELLEMIADPAVNTLRMDGTGTIYIQEVADPVQEDSYPIGGVVVSNFVFPSWFEPFRRPNSVAFDQMGSVTEPFALAKGGYISIFKRNRWSQIFGSVAAAGRFNAARKHRVHLIEKLAVR